MTIFDWVGKRLASYLSQEVERDIQVATSKPDDLAATLKKGDVLLVDGNSRISTAIKFLTQSTWSHAALYMGHGVTRGGKNKNEPLLVEADVNEGVRTVPLSMYSRFHTRICRPVGLFEKDIDAVIDYVVSRIGHTYDLKNVLDLVRYLVHSPPVPRGWKRKLLALGSGDPTKAICSSMIAQAFQSVHYPILPEMLLKDSPDRSCKRCYREILLIKHHSLFTPRDFDASPYFEIIKPTLSKGFNPYQIEWSSLSTQDNTVMSAYRNKTQFAVIKKTGER
ncbi:YiiX/YebB-like N1pC/P60 family cysteine hydrolase [Desulfobacula sp.]|uniref:YiiX/YebB-like N1pC/P60 family cysteine hydrolase n=1 Tax=Desulfobacula sp. TaxID=2593537 RepID=UPI0026098952|nr:YiiX/YebB-like N1pC/P60 family cysteine hydrolase [Desulfobacula sp.]